MARMLKVQLESKLNTEISPSMPIMQWLVRWAAMRLSRYRVGPDARTPYERQKGKACDLEIVPFGETMNTVRIGG